MTHISELEPGDELICFMRLGLALERKRRPRDGYEYRQVPSGTQKARSDALTRFTGTVIANDSTNEVITLSTTRVDSHMIGYNRRREPPLRADIHYSALGRVRRVSEIAFEGDDKFISRPTSTQGFGTQTKAYRTLEEIDLS